LEEEAASSPAAAAAAADEEDGGEMDMDLRGEAQARAARGGRGLCGRRARSARRGPRIEPVVDRRDDDGDHDDARSS
jgi:hypothetical protein